MTSRFANNDLTVTNFTFADHRRLYRTSARQFRETLGDLRFLLWKDAVFATKLSWVVAWAFPMAFFYFLGALCAAIARGKDGVSAYSRGFI